MAGKSGPLTALCGTNGGIFLLSQEQFVNKALTLKPALTISGLKKSAEKAVPAVDS